MKKTSKKILTLLLAILAAFTLFSACGGKKEEAEAPTEDTGEKAPAEDKKEENKEEGDKKENKTEKEDSPSEEETDDAIIGSWELIYTLCESEYGKDNETGSYCNMSDDNYGSKSQMIIRRESGKLIADYKYEEYESTDRFYGNELIRRDEAAYEGCKNKDYYYEFSNPFNDDYESKKFTMTDDETLIGVSEYIYGEKGTDDYSRNLYTDVYLKSDSPKLKDRESLRYFDTVTVSNVEDMINNFKNNTKIILESGKYDFSLLDESKITNEALLGMNEMPESYRTYTLGHVSNVCIEAAEGADVLICTGNSYDPAIFFYNVDNLTLRGLTCGHVVEPGTCSGSVVGLEACTGAKIEDCHLYGCGTYGIEALNCDGVEVNDSEIYDCTYGLVDIHNTGDMKFNNCTLRDSSNLSLIVAESGYDIAFNKCTFKNNTINSDYINCYFVDLSEYTDVTFTDCSFENNQYDKFANRKVKLVNCTMNDNGDPDISNAELMQELDPKAIIKSYEEASERQSEIDYKFKNDNIDQTTMNRLAYEEYDMWDTLLNNIWGYLKNTLGEQEMEPLTAEQKEWIQSKEDAVRTAAADFEGGSMQPMIENGTAAEQTQKRVEYLMEKYIKDKE